MSGIYNKELTWGYTVGGMKGRALSMSIDGVADETYAYDTFGRINGVNEISYAYLTDSNLLLQVTRPNGVNTVIGYESNRNLVTQVTNGSVSTFGYTNNAIGNRTNMSRTGSVFTTPDVLTYGYNDRSEVTSGTSNNNALYNYSYNFDPIGNRLTASLAGNNVNYTANVLNQYTAVNTDTSTYDFDGNMLSNGSWSYTWNGENRLIKAENGSAKLEFDYDYAGRRIFKKVYNGETLVKHTRFVYNGYKLIEELDALNNNATLRKYTWQPGSLGLDVPLSVFDAAANATYYYSTDANKNISELTDVNGNAVAHYEYSPFGMQTVTTGAYAATNPFRFSSEYFDSETGLVYYNYRYYDTILGRWLSRDPIGEKGGLNLYGFVSNNDLDLFDNLGLQSSDCCVDGKKVPKVKDDAGRECCPDEIKTIEIRNAPTTSGMDVGHSFVHTPNHTYGFYPSNTWHAYSGKGTFQDDSDHQYDPALTYSYRACPETVKVVDEAIMSDVALDADSYSLPNIYGRNCSGMACRWINDGGLKPPHSPYIPLLRPAFKQR